MKRTRRFKMYAVFALLGTAISACDIPTSAPGGDEVADSPLPRSGVKIAQAHCAACHSIGTTGTSPHSEALEFRKFSKYYPVRELEEALAEGIYVGHPDMPVFRFEPDEVDALIKYIQSIQEPLET